MSKGYMYLTLIMTSDLHVKLAILNVKIPDTQQIHNNRVKNIFSPGLEDGLESLALNESTDFASKNYILFAKVLRSLLAPRSNPKKKAFAFLGFLP